MKGHRSCSQFPISVLFYMFILVEQMMTCTKLHISSMVWSTRSKPCWQWSILHHHQYFHGVRCESPSTSKVSQLCFFFEVPNAIFEFSSSCYVQKFLANLPPNDCTHGEGIRNRIPHPCSQTVWTQQQDLSIISFQHTSVNISSEIKT